MLVEEKPDITVSKATQNNSAAQLAPRALEAAQRDMPSRRMEPRATTRYAKMLKAVCVTEEASPRKLYGKTIDISLGGVSFVSGTHLSYPTWVRVYLKLGILSDGNWNIFESRCRVVCSVLCSQQGGFRLSLEFQSLTDAQRNQLKKFLER